MVGAGRDRPRRRRRPRGRRRRLRRGRRRLLPDPRPRQRAAVRGDRPAHRPGDGAGGEGGRRRPAGLPRRARARGRGAVAAPALAGGGRRDPAGFGGAHRRAARRRRPRVRLGLVRDAPLPHRAAAGHGHAAVGAQPDPADRRPGRAPLPGRLRDPAVLGAPLLRRRRPRRHELRRDDAAVRRGHRPAPAPDPPGAAVHPVAVEPLGRPDHAGAGRDRPAAGGVAAQHRRLRRARHRAVRARSARRPARFRRRRPPGRAARQGLRRRDPLGLGVRARRPVRSAAHRSGLGRRQPLPRRTHPDDDRTARGRVACGGGDRRGDRLVLLPARVADPRMAGPRGRRRRTPAGTPGPAPALRRRRPRLLAGRGAAGGSAAAAARRDAPARPGLAGVPRGTPGLRGRTTEHGAAPAGHLRPARAGRAPVLVGHRRVPRRRVRRDGPRCRPCGRAVGEPVQTSS